MIGAGSNLCASWEHTYICLDTRFAKGRLYSSHFTSVHLGGAYCQVNRHYRFRCTQYKPRNTFATRPGTILQTRWASLDLLRKHQSSDSSTKYFLALVSQSRARHGSFISPSPPILPSPATLFQFIELFYSPVHISRPMEQSTLPMMGILPQTPSIR